MMLYARRLAFVAAAALSLASTGFAAKEKEKTTPSVAQPTHEQIAVIKVENTSQLNTFCLDRDGNVLAACGGDLTSYRVTKEGRKAVTVSRPKELRTYSPDGKLLKTWKVPMTPQAVNVIADGSVYVGGDGKLVKLNPQGQVVAEARSPHISDMKTFRAQVRQQAIQQSKMIKTSYERTIKTYEDRVKKIESVAEAKRSATQKLQLTTYQRQLELYKRILKQNVEISDARIDSMMKYKTKVSAIAVTDKDLFVACPSTKGYGYDVWRLTHDFKNPRVVVSRLSGCCGQMDIQCSPTGDVFVAENSRHRVSRYTRDGKLVKHFGKRDRKGEEPDGFGSCCNPMNLRFDADGSVYTAESTVGRIKKFSPTGQLLGVIGTAKIAAGCKHVAIGVNKDASRVYMLDLTYKRIFVLGRKDGVETARKTSTTGAE